MTYSARLVGAARLRATLRAAGADLGDLKTANAAAAATVAAAAGVRAPRRSGALASSVRGNRAVGKAVVMAGRGSVAYAGPIHWGWAARGIEPNPFVIDAAEATEPVWTAAYAVDVQRAVNNVRGA